jgi:NTP pyrophosphatase (non-canonical NTP hydrolase)
MDSDKMQERVDRLVLETWKNKYFGPLCIGLQLTEEAGEVAGAINRAFGDQVKKTEDDHASIKTEVGDVMFALCCLANSLGFTLEECFEKNMKKLGERDSDRHERIEEKKS